MFEIGDLALVSLDDAGIGRVHDPCQQRLYMLFDGCDLPLGGRDRVFGLREPLIPGLAESFIGSFRDELLNETLFSTLAEARTQIIAWKEDSIASTVQSSALPSRTAASGRFGVTTDESGTNLPNRDCYIKPMVDGTPCLKPGAGRCNACRSLAVTDWPPRAGSSAG